MITRLAFILGCFGSLLLQATETDPHAVSLPAVSPSTSLGTSLPNPSNPFSVRVAVLRNTPTLEETLQTLCRNEYQGTIRVVKNKQGRYAAINILDIEDFLLGVIGREMDPRGPLEALKAQAIAARSHALYQASISDDQPYDLVANLSQAYAGKTKLHKNVVVAIEATRGQVLYYEGKPIPAYFHESCGGHTETVASVWQPISSAKNGKGLMLPGSARCPYCLQAKENKWKFEVPVATLRQTLQRDGLKVGASPSVAIAEKAPGGHALKIAIRSETGEAFVSGEKLRALLGYSNLRSTLFAVHRAVSADGTLSGNFIFGGDGYGHGVGLCQFGARGMAERGATCDAILDHYFPHCQVRPYAVETLACARVSEKVEMRN